MAMISRRKTRQVMVGNVPIGGAAPVAVQSMTSGYTHDIDKCVREINKLAAGGADIVRVAVPERKDTEALKEIIKQVQVPIVADVHFHFQRALEALEAGVSKIRLNPGNINDRKEVEMVIDACKEHKVPIRVGVNEGSIVERKDKQKRMRELGGVFGNNRHGHILAIMITKLEEYLDIFYARNFYDIVISAKSIDPILVIDAYTEISRRFEHPLHLGVTHAGPKETGTIRSVVPLGTLLANGIGDTIRISYANDPIYEVQDGLELLYVLGLRQRRGAELIACPTCGRIQVDLFTLVQHVNRKLKEEITVPIKVAVMGCVVNGPGECEGADVAIFAGDKRGIIYVQGQKVANVPEEQILDALLEECKKFQAKVQRGEARLGEKVVDILPPDPIGELGSGYVKIAASRAEGGTALPVFNP
ncbi:MAG: flavodoxin-dependent (E)-4-hydroxy-3-methylbut-2-enyl-diphosphate synthase [Planctomycetes bacterium]|jgi:(E)-4-hydroxy-3-methylbut-2-enyl-diphosphate synthase|nr:flavodoxin-dependent (E)-4-hydroxy-3-methylbut-2-enyl-diphosphate synthase [Planctomycetota bacterium]